jgi:hypothetical protein
VRRGDASSSGNAFRCLFSIDKKSGWYPLQLYDLLLCLNKRGIMQRLVYMLLFVLAAVGADAVILAGGDGTQNTSAPAGGQGWDYVGRIDHASARSSVTYISNNWFITAYHIKALDNPGGVILGGTTYSIDPNSWMRLINSEAGNADLIMFRVVGGTVGLPGLSVRAAETPDGSVLTMIGNGRNREATETTWNYNWVEGGRPTFYRGHKWADGATKRWGVNHKDNDVGLVNSGQSFGYTDLFSVVFDDVGGSEAQGATYDSGGGVFYNNGGQWQLAGIMLLTSGFSDQPSATAVYDNETYIADMQYYAAQIVETARIDDLDNDGIPDGWEYAVSGSTTGVVAAADQDGDGFTGTEEWIADTDPTDRNSFFRVIHYTGATNLVFTSSSNRQYRLESRVDLSDPAVSWQAHGDWFNGTSPHHALNLMPPSDPAGFYRIQVQLR